MKKSTKILTAIVSLVLVVGLFPLASLVGLFNNLLKLNASPVNGESNEKPLIVIGTIGDPHADYSLQDTAPYIRTAFITAMDALKAEGADLLLVGGDMTSDNQDNGSSFRWERSVYDRTIDAYKTYSSAATKTGITLWALGNHDYEVGRLNEASETEGDYNSYVGFMDMMLETAGQPKSLLTQNVSGVGNGHWLGAHYVVNGFDFIIINQKYRTASGSAGYPAETLAWLDETLNGIGADKTVFITGHFPLSDNKGLPAKNDGLQGTGYTDFVNVLNKYDNAIYLYGHEHGGRNPQELLDSTYISSDSFERITHYDSTGAVVTDRNATPTSFVTAFMGSPSYYNYSLNPGWLTGEDPEIIQAMTISVYKDRIEFKMINCGEQQGKLREPFVWTMKRDVLGTGDTEAEETLETWNLPIDWSTGTQRDLNGWDIPVYGQWSISGYSNLDSATAIFTPSTKTVEQLRGANGNVKEAHQSYLGNNYNESYVQDKTVTANGTDGWYVNYHYRWGKTVVKSGGNVITATAHQGYPGAIAFTAPSAGLYSYTQLFESANTISGAQYTATVRKNGFVLDSFTVTEKGIAHKFDGIIELKQGDVLMFAFEHTGGTVPTNDNEAKCFHVKSFEVTKLASAYESYNVPMNWGAEDGMERDSNGWPLAKRGAWRLSSFSDPSNIKSIRERKSSATQSIADSTYISSNSPYPWMNAKENRGSTGDEWYVNAQTRWSGITTFDNGDNSTYFGVVPNNNSLSTNATVLFTAPSDGVYYYADIFKQAMFLKDEVAVEVEATVRKNGVVLCSFTPTEVNASENLCGKVILEEGDFLMFTFTLKSSAAIENHNHVIKFLNGSSVYKVAELPANFKGEVDVTLEFDGTSYNDAFGNVTLGGFNTATGKIYGGDDLALDVIDGIWYVYEPDGKNNYEKNPAKDRYLWAGTVNGGITKIGGHLYLKDIGSSIIFEAPVEGVYEITAALGSAYISFQSRNAWSEYYIAKEDGTVLAYATNEGKADKTVTTVSAIAVLAKGEKVVIVRAPIGDADWENRSCEGSAVVTISELNHVCSADTLRYVAGTPASCLEDGSHEYYVCYCGAKYKDAKANTVFSGDVTIPATNHATSDTYEYDDNEHWQLCANDCGVELVRTAHDYTGGTCVCSKACPHDWNATTGKCELCGSDCAHAWNPANGICGTCGASCEHDVTADGATCVSEAVCSHCGFTYAKNPENHTGVNDIVPNNNGTHNVVCECGKTVDENVTCVYGDDNICDKCGYDGTVEIEKNDLNNAISNIVNGGSNNVTVHGPNGTMADDYVVEKIEGVEYEYKYFNIAFDDEDNFFLRHHIVCEGELTVTVNGATVVLKSDSDNVYYFDTYYEAGQYHVGQDIEINGDAYNVSLYSYIKLALEGEVADLDASEETFLRALYDYNEALR